jgi:hypothetical protein
MLITILMGLSICLMLGISNIRSFTANAALQTPVNLGSAANFVVLTKSGISTTGTTSIVGNIGVSPIAHTAITGFGLIMDPSNTFATSSLVIGNVYAADYAPPTPTVMTTAISDMETAYTNAAGRTLPTATELGAGTIGSAQSPLSAGLYKWSSNVIISTDLTLSGSASDVWIFQIAGTLTVGSGIHVILAGGAQAQNIFWQVAGQTTLGTTSILYGNVLDQTAIVMDNGATLYGRALAQTAVTLIANTITGAPPGTTAPTVIGTLPANASVAVSSAIWATFSEAMNPLTINTTTFTLMQGVTPIPGMVTYAGITATFTPEVDMAPNTVYTATITTGAKDVNGHALASNYTWNFTTGAATTAPTVGGEILPVNMLQLLAPLLAYAIVIAGTVLAVAKFKRRKQ